QLSDPATRHGFGGWLPLSMPDPTPAVGDKNLLRLLFRAFVVTEMVLAAEKQKASKADGTPAAVRMADILSDRRGTEAALQAALPGLLAAAKRAEDRMPSTVKDALAVFKGEVEKLAQKPGEAKALADAQELLNTYAHELPRLHELFQLILNWLDPN